MQVRRGLLGVVLFVALVGAATPAAPAAGAQVSLTVFHEHLTPYGRWVVAGSIGHVWVPRVATGWAPYVDGQWVYTDYGWTWVSADPWGDLPCHYGAWAWADPYGWVWAPGTVWAPAWVTWAYSDDYIGWAPVPPTFALSVTGYVGAPIVVSQTRYVFVPTRQFVGVPVATVRVPLRDNTAIFARSVKTTRYEVSGGVVRTAGPPIAGIERVAAHKIERVSIDRVKARPTTIAEAGVSNGSAVRAALPAAERRAPETNTRAKAQAAPDHSAAHQKTKPESSRSAAAPAESHTAAKAPSKAESKPKSEAKKSKPAAQPPSSAEHKGERKPNEGQVKHAPPPAAAEHAQPGKSGPTEQTRVASHSAGPPAHARPPQAPKPKPEEKKPQQPPAEKPQQ
jgi:hypothetical protein